MKFLESMDLMSRVLDAQDEGTLTRALSHVVQQCGFSTFMTGAQVPNELGEPQYSVVSAYPEAWQVQYAHRGYQVLDPTVSHCQGSTEPLMWSEKVFRQAKALEVLEEARGYGISHGISVSFHERSGVKSMLSLVRDTPMTVSAAETAHLQGAAKTLAGVVHFAMTRIADRTQRQRCNPSLTRQETECMKWAAMGKTTWETSRIMGIAEPTVVFHLKNVMRKLNAINRVQAVAIALRLGLIS